MNLSDTTIRCAAGMALPALFGLLLAACAGSPPSVSTEKDRPRAAVSSPELPDPTQPVPRRDLVGKALDNILTLRARNSSGEEIALGSGFFIKGGHVVTNAHVVADAAWVEIVDLQGRLVATAPYALAIDIDNDLAVLPTPHAEKQGLSLSENPVQPGDDVWAFGAPLGLEGSTSRGVVSAFREKEGMELIQITAPISQGSSGGPVLNDRGEVIGIATLIMTGGQNLNFAVPAEKLRAQQFTEANRERFPPASALEAERDESATQLISMMLNMAGAPEIDIGRQYRDRLDQDSPILKSNPYSVYQFRGTAGQRLQVDVMSSEFDSAAILIRETGLFGDDGWIIEDDDSGDGTDARVVATLPDTDTYYLLVLSYGATLGAYTLATSEVADSRDGRLGDRWLLVGKSITDDRYYIDTQTLRHSGGNVTVWVQTKAAEVQQLSGGDDYDSSLVFFEFDCAGRRQRMKTASYRLEGRLVLSEDVPSFQQTWSSIGPDTMAEVILEAVCRRQ